VTEERVGAEEMAVVIDSVIANLLIGS
jgi:hypothetical protein